MYTQNSLETNSRTATYNRNHADTTFTSNNRSKVHSSTEKHRSRQLRDLFDERLSGDRIELVRILITPEKAVKWYLGHRREDLTAPSFRTHQSPLNHFIQWISIVGIDNLNQLENQKIQSYPDWRVEEALDSIDQLAPKTKSAQIDVTRKSIEDCEILPKITGETDE